MNRNALIGTVLTGIISALSYYAARYVAPDTNQELIIGAILTAAIALLSQVQRGEEPPKSEQQSIKGNDKGESCIVIGVKWR